MAEGIQIQKKDPSDVIIALVGCPNVGKSTLFNYLTGMNQHTGNWPGKTVCVAQGRYTYKGKTYILVDLPGTYSLVSQSMEEQVTAEFIRSGQADCTLVLADATCLERTLLPVLQVMELTDRMAVCVNLMDEAARGKLSLDLPALERELGVPTVGVSAGSGQNMERLREILRNAAEGFLPVHPRKVRLEKSVSIFDWKQGSADRITAAFSKRAAEISELVVHGNRQWKPSPMDRIALGKVSGPIMMVVLLLLVFWLTIKAANVPSEFLQTVFDNLKVLLTAATGAWPGWLSGILIDGVYHTMTCVIAVMLPPLLIFFPLFSLLEDFGYLPRAAFLLDHRFCRCGSCGKQALTMAMGFGCNAAGVMGARIITSRRERLIAIVTNSLVPCNGRFPSMIILIGIFFSHNDLIAALILVALVMLGVGATFLSSKVLSKTVLSREPSQMILELPPYRRPNLKQILTRALVDRVFAVLLRAVAVSAPAGAVIWILQQIQWQGMSLLSHCAAFLESLGVFLGMNGIILTAFLISFPANELLLPSVLMLLGSEITTGAGNAALGQVLLANGWTVKTAVCTLLFLIFHWPCSTTCLTIHKETGSWKWTLAAVLLPVAIGVFLCGLAANL